jgi:hypothetical protein
MSPPAGDIACAQGGTQLIQASGSSIAVPAPKFQAWKTAPDRPTRTLSPYPEAFRPHRERERFFCLPFGLFAYSGGSAILGEPQASLQLAAKSLIIYSIWTS